MGIFDEYIPDLRCLPPWYRQTEKERKRLRCTTFLDDVVEVFYNHR